MGQLQKVSWRTAGYAALGTVVAAASVVAIINSDGVRPTSLTSSAASRWLVDQVNKRVVLVDGLAGKVVAKIATESDSANDVAVQGAGGAFLVGTATGSISSISSSKLQLGAAQAVGVLLDPGVKFGVGTSGLTVVSPETGKASIVAVDDVTRPITVPKATDAYVAADGSMWMLSQTQATHVNIDESTATNPLRSLSTNQVTTVGSRAVAYDSANRTVRWLDGGDVPIDSITNASQALLQLPSDDAPCVWLGAGETLVCVGQTRIERTLTINGLNIQQNDRLAVSGTAAVVVSDTNDAQRIDLERRQLGTGQGISVPANAQLTITASGNLVWLDDTQGEDAWVVHRFGVNHIRKNATAPEYDSQGQAQDNGSNDVGPVSGSGNASGSDEVPKFDDNGHEDPPVAVDDSVTARAGSTITIPVTVNDYDPDDEPIAVLSVGSPTSATHGTTDVLDGTSVAYRPNPGFSGTDSFEYTITDAAGKTDVGRVKVELFDPNSPNRPPITRPDKINTRVNRPVTIDVLANDIDPERDMLTVSTFQTSSDAKIIDVSGPSKLPALEYTPPLDKAGIYTFTYQAADPQGGVSQKTDVTVDVSTADSKNEPPIPMHDAISLPVGVTVPLDVKANDSDPDGDELTITRATAVPGVTAVVRSQLLDITLAPGAPPRSIVQYTLNDGDPTHDRTGKVLVLRQPDTAPNRAPVANADTDRVVIGNSVKIPVTANDADPENDPISLLVADQPADGAGTTVVDGNSIRFTPNLPDITESTPVTFNYTITDGHGNEAIGKVTVNVLVEPLPRAPFARDDFADTVTDRPVIINVLNNDTDPSGGSPHLLGNPSCPNGGVATVTPDERVKFEPPDGQSGVVVRCTYRISNAQGLPAEASIIVTISAPQQGNHEPTLNESAKTQSVVVGDTLTLHASLIATDADSDPLLFTAASVDSPTHGSVDFTGKSESLVYTPPATGSTDKVPVADTLDITISDGHDGNHHDKITVLIFSKPTVATVPPLTVPITRPATVGDTLLIDVVAELRDLNSTTSLTLSGVTADSGPGSAELTNGVAVIKATGPGLIVANYTVTDSNNKATASNQIRVTVAEAVPANPPVAFDDSMTIASGSSNSVDLFANDTGITDPGDKPVATLQNRPPSNFGTVQVVGGILTFVAAPDASGLVPLDYTLSDGSGQSSTATVTLNLLACSVSPPTVRNATIFTPYQTAVSINLYDYVLSGVIQPDSIVGGQLTSPTGVYTPPDGMNDLEVVTYTVENGCHQTVQGRLTIDVNRPPVGGTITRDLARGDNLTLFVADVASDDEKLKITSIDGNPSWVSLVFPTGQPGTLDETTINAAPPSNAASGTYHITVHVADPGGLTAVASVTFNISNVAPVAIADQYTTDVTDSLYPIPDPTVNDTDTEPGVLTIQTASVVDGPATIQSITGNVIVVLIGHGVSTLNYTIVDQGGLTASSTITITSNRAPSVGDVFGHTRGQPTLQTPFFPNDPDGDPMSATCNNNPSDFTVVVNTNPNPGSGATVEPTHPVWALDITVENPNFSDPSVFQCTVRDSFGATAVSNVTITRSD